jgi:opacity protein-like surface antigen
MPISKLGSVSCIAVVAVFYFICNSVFANGSKQTIVPTKTNFDSTSGFYVGASVGASFGKVGQDQRVVDLDSFQNKWIYDYTKDSNKKDALLANINGGYEFALPNNFLADVGVGIYKPVDHYDVDGKVLLTWDNTPMGHVYDYSYNVQTWQAMLEGKLKYKIQRIIPYVLIGVGAAWNKADSFVYKELPQQGALWEKPNFGSRSTTNFAYQLGVGFDVVVTDNDYVDFYYRYADLGKIEFSEPTNIDFPSKFNAGKLKTQDVMVGYTHRF